MVKPLEFVGVWSSAYGDFILESIDDGMRVWIKELVGKRFKEVIE